MSTRSQRGRAVQTRKSSASLILLMGAVALLAVAIVATIALQNRQTAATPGREPARPATNVPVGKDANGFFFKGNANAPVTVTEYSDYQCPGCAYYATVLSSQFEQEYIATGKVKFVYHEYPLSGHANGAPAAYAARCAGEQGADKYWAMHDYLFTNQRQWSAQSDPRAQFVAYARQIGLDTAAFEQCYASNRFRDAINQAKAAGDALRIPGTPSFAVNGQLVNTAGASSVEEIYARMRQAVDAALGGR
ncbi:MAG: DsbA family protein [Roseiflexus sp.]|nr:DsbA family protein [Roseiflexus sp.]MCS7289955.1 DsbA family protein [Roseiflexus sp.]MDW8146897.1 thioredoxin domain-containing protein [Roseiflexaceae bacterium]MDW8233357.1 thioredoxin domain-containing protein [Roseiflexaceae bacterium]